MKTIISETLKHSIPDFKIGIITYHDIAVSDSPQFFKEQMHALEKELMLSFEEKSVGELEGVKEWRQLFKRLGTDPSRYRPSHEALLRRLYKGQSFPLIHSAADVNNYLSARYQIPLGIYDCDKLSAPLSIRLGGQDDDYDALNGREMKMAQKLVSADRAGAFGSPIVDSKRTMTTADTRNALHIVYLKPSDSLETCYQLLQSISHLFTEVNGGQSHDPFIL
ncbi:DNA/RNA-binding domain of Phe-tRNA-synthetase-like protein [Pullulanibacillus pueri]|uniref:B3/B4 tRNA-binding domain-containing protein n=1 Tax=Pullulanibacillus pueri TaxID=1437324 RepID=A0A8J3EMY9_9BACL|nr:phenylalanine--tRNA ligase beta subunit-related protein [Pullulanibacillus pueri]MBM7683584.1 DNA/RNA-binding domain of Phe-tRNA-synthetase-like protein [Pullulanibacillus pueri]GGH84509.1 hypothetical protein GCM10007096_27750 [Pullulanibacillus pueri]